MIKTVLKVDGMSCEHCVSAVEGAARELPGVSSAVADLAAGIVTVEHDPDEAPVGKIIEKIEEQGFEVAGAAG